MMSFNTRIIFNTNINLISWFSQPFTIKVHYIDALPCLAAAAASKTEATVLWRGGGAAAVYFIVRNLQLSVGIYGHAARDSRTI